MLQIVNLNKNTLILHRLQRANVGLFISKHSQSSSESTQERKSEYAKSCSTNTGWIINNFTAYFRVTV